MHTDDTHETDYSLVNTEPFDIYSQKELYNEDIQETVYGTNEEFNTLYYDIEHDLNDEVSEEQVPDQASISTVSNFYIHMHTAKYTISVSCSS